MYLVSWWTRKEQASPHDTGGRTSHSRIHTSTTPHPEIGGHVREVLRRDGRPEAEPTHPVQTVGAAEELLDQLVVCQSRDVSGTDSDLSLPCDGDGFVSGGLLFHRLRLLLKEKHQAGGVARALRPLPHKEASLSPLCALPRS